MSVADRLAEVLGPGAQVTQAHDVVTATVPRGQWVAAATAARDDDALDGRFFDRLVGTDLDGSTEVLLRLWSVRHRHALHLRTTCPDDDAHLPSLSGVFAGAAWHERETGEMLGVVFDGHPDPSPLLLAPGFVGHQLRRDFALTDRVDQVWPGAVEPGESTPNPRRLPPGLTR